MPYTVDKDDGNPPHRTVNEVSNAEEAALTSPFTEEWSIDKAIPENTMRCKGCDPAMPKKHPDKVDKPVEKPGRISA